MASKPEVQKALMVLSAAYPRFELPIATVEIYCRLLLDLDFDTLKAATLHCATVYKFFPTVAEIREAATELKTMAEGIPSDAEAWGQVLEQIRSKGSYGVPEFSHPLIANVVRQLGWLNLCLSENQPADRARFMDAYSQAFKDSKRRNQMLPEVLQIVDGQLNADERIKKLAASMEA